MSTLALYVALLKYVYRWYSQFLKGQDWLVELAGLKLTKGRFKPTDKDHVLAILSQRISVDTVLVCSEALQLADRGVANHMSLMGISYEQRTFQTNAPSELMLALAAARLLYTENTVLGTVLDTFNHNLCEAGLVEKGHLGELAARILLTVARDLAAPKKSFASDRDLLQPVPLMGFLDKLFGDNEWCITHRNDFDKSFKDTYTNFTHWIVTKDPLPEDPSQCAYHYGWLFHMLTVYQGNYFQIFGLGVPHFSATFAKNRLTS